MTDLITDFRIQGQKNLNNQVLAVSCNHHPPTKPSNHNLRLDILAWRSDLNFGIECETNWLLFTIMDPSYLIHHLSPLGLSKYMDGKVWFLHSVCVISFVSNVGLGIGKAVLKKNGESIDCSGRYVFSPVRKTGFCLSHSRGCLDGGEFGLIYLAVIKSDRIFNSQAFQDFVTYR